MEVIKVDSFEMKAKQLGLKDVDSGFWFLLGCDLMFQYNSCRARIEAYGVVPIDLSIDLYNYFKNAEVRTISNTKYFQLKNPELDPCDVVKHESIDFRVIALEAKLFEKEIEQVYKDKLEKAL